MDVVQEPTSGSTHHRCHRCRVLQQAPQRQHQSVTLDVGPGAQQRALFIGGVCFTALILPPGNVGEGLADPGAHAALIRPAHPPLGCHGAQGTCGVAPATASATATATATVTTACWGASREAHSTFPCLIEPGYAVLLLMGGRQYFVSESTPVIQVCLMLGYMWPLYPNLDLVLGIIGLTCSRASDSSYRVGISAKSDSMSLYCAHNSACLEEQKMPSR